MFWLIFSQVPDSTKVEILLNKLVHKTLSGRNAAKSKITSIVRISFCLRAVLGTLKQKGDRTVIIKASSTVALLLPYVSYKS